MSEDSSSLGWPLMRDNLARADLDRLIDFLRQDDPVLTQSSQVRAFEREWSEWLGVRHSVFVNSGSSANLITMAALKETSGLGEVLVPAITWVSDIAALLHLGFTPVFVDIDRRTLGMDNAQAIAKLSPRTKAVFITHILGYNAITRELLTELGRRGIPLIEDACEAHGATFQGKKVGTFGRAANFSFYYAHHLTTVEGGMVSTDDADWYELCRMLRAHGLVREMDDPARKGDFAARHPDLSSDFIFAVPAYNVRSTEMSAVLGRSQLPRLDEAIEQRNQNLRLFLSELDPSVFQTDFAVQGASNYALTLVLKEPDPDLNARVARCLAAHRVEFRRGTSGGGNQLRQPYLTRLFGPDAYRQCPNADHVHFFGYYIGNYPSLAREKISRLAAALNRCATEPGRNVGEAQPEAACPGR